MIPAGGGESKRRPMRAATDEANTAAAPAAGEEATPPPIDTRRDGVNNGPMARDDCQGSRSVVVAPGVTLPAGTLRFTFARSGGPGGQHANKTSTRATLSVPVDALRAALPADALERLRTLAGNRWTGEQLQLTAAGSRSQLANRRACLARLEQLLRAALHRPRPRRPTRPTRAAVERRLHAKRRRGQRKSERRESRGGDAP